jgi:peptidyl-prolyl cis-trans isomerase SurA
MVWLAPLLLVMAHRGLPAQVGSEYQLVDRVVAVVGNKPIMRTKVDETLEIFLQSSADYPRDSASIHNLRQEMLDRLVEDEIWLQAAMQDTAITVSPEMVQESVDSRMRQLRERYSSELDFDRSIREAGFGTQDEYRRWLADQTREQLFRDAFQQRLRQTGEIRPIPPTERELRAEFERATERPPERPPTVGFRQIVVRPQPDSGALRAALVRAESVLVKIRGGEDFAELAREYSDDPGTKDQGGELGWQRRGSGLAPEFEQAAFRLRPGQTSNLVLTSFGFHIIQVQRTEPGHAQIRHILVAPEITDENRQAAWARADAAATALREGASFDSLLAVVHDKDEQSLVERAVRERLPPTYQEALVEAQPQDVIGPVTFESPGFVKYAVILFQEALAADEFTFDELRDRLREQLAEDNGVRRYLEVLKRNTYVHIRM